MRKNKVVGKKNDLSILAVDDDEIMTLTLQSYFQSAGFQVDTENDPVKAIERIRTGSYDILLLDFLMRPICGDQGVAEIRKFNTDLFIILLTGHKSMAPPIKTVRELDIQGYYEKSDRFDQLELLIESCVKSIRQMRTIRNYRDGLRQLLDQIPILYQAEDLNELLNIILKQACSALQCQDAFIYLAPSSPHKVLGKEWTEESVFRGVGRYEGEEEMGGYCYRNSFEDGQDIVQKNNCFIAAICNSYIKNGGAGDEVASLLPSDRFGVLFLDMEEHIPDSAEALFALYAKQVGAAICNLALRSLLQHQNHELGEAYSTMRNNYVGMIDAMRLMVDAKDYYTRGHSERVSFYSVLIAKALNKDNDYVERIQVAGLFHDIGKIGISDAILRKSGKLTNDEYEIIKTHSAQGRKILSSISAFSHIANIVGSHHERYDGGGYPDGLRGTDIPEEARIICVADSFDAMTSKRSYRDSLSLETAKKELLKGEGTQFDPEIAKTFLNILENYDEIQRELESVYPDTVINTNNKEGRL